MALGPRTSTSELMRKTFSPPLPLDTLSTMSLAFPRTIDVPFTSYFYDTASALDDVGGNLLLARE